ncbi:hypothetical protein MF271_07380 [Deinococcus sp. KNUC1210]|uniref:hypothetical protein n=1 Tax=Deinococcus sp. KNUC1210 TaxID=2917691 RepID=UPI001EF0ED25|nr:hypothetical protein [Deinococcus sp. KNUC1210]ULH16401.1 hypothetical protein MF271_07380 [Deinococcus sp. KNUC1210]
MTGPLFSATIRDAVPLGGRFLLSVVGAGTRPQLPCRLRIEGLPDELTLLDIVSSPTLWLLSEVTLVVEAQAQADWRGWAGRVVAEVGSG